MPFCSKWSCVGPLSLSHFDLACVVRFEPRVRPLSAPRKGDSDHIAGSAAIFLHHASNMVGRSDPDPWSCWFCARRAPREAAYRAGLPEEAPDNEEQQPPEQNWARLVAGQQRLAWRRRLGRAGTLAGVCPTERSGIAPETQRGRSFSRRPRGLLSICDWFLLVIRPSSACAARSAREERAGSVPAPSQPWRCRTPPEKRRMLVQNG